MLWQELNAAVKAHAEGLDATLMTAQLHGVDSNNGSSESLTPEGRLGMLQAQMVVTEGRLAAATTARERAERLLQAANEHSASLKARPFRSLVALLSSPYLVACCCLALVVINGIIQKDLARVGPGCVDVRTRATGS